MLVVQVDLAVDAALLWVDPCLLLLVQAVRCHQLTVAQCRQVHAPCHPLAILDALCLRPVLTVA